jgi:A/G-specific adenine glycosylase
VNWIDLLVDWYEKNKRDLPWRADKNPYKIWLSEVILQQTRVAQGLPYFYKFIDKYPDIQSFAKANEQEILFIWQGLGYYSRGRNMLNAAQQIVNEHNGLFPKEPKVLQKIMGIGPYTAAAISSIAFDYPIPVIDGNVYRVVSRMFQIETPIPTEKARKQIEDILTPFIKETKASTFNQAFMELGALICLPQNPNCNICPLKYSCLSNIHKSQTDYPIKAIKIKAKNTHFHYFFIESANGTTYIYKRESGIWQQLHEFPFIESYSKLELEEIKTKLQKVFASKKFNVHSLFSINHKLTHLNIDAHFYKVKLKDKVGVFENLSTFEIKFEDLKQYPTHTLLKKFLNKLNSIHND